MLLISFECFLKHLLKYAKIDLKKFLFRKKFE